MWKEKKSLVITEENFSRYMTTTFKSKNRFMIEQKKKKKQWKKPTPTREYEKKKGEILKGNYILQMWCVQRLIVFQAIDNVEMAK